MSPLEDLPPDLRATLSLLVDRGKSYADVASLLGIPESAVRERAHAALDALADGQANGAAPARIDQTPGDGLEAPARYGARDVGARSGLEPDPERDFESDTPRARIGSGAPAERSRARPRANGRSTPALPVSRRGGAIVLAAIAAVVVVVVVLVFAGGGGSSHKSGVPAGSSGASAQATTGATGKTPKITNQITLTPSEAGGKAIGIVEILTEGNEHAFYIAAEHLQPSQGFTYVVWLYNSPTSAEAISKSPNVGSDGRLQGGALLPPNAADFHQILLTRETSERPTAPGPQVLSGTFSLGS
jgi:hypothetical protein